MNKKDLPNQGFIFWPVGTGDSTTIRVCDDTFIQVDLHHTEKSEDEKEDAFHIIDELIELLPIKNDKPFLSVFALTHPDQDHIKGFKELLDEVTIGEIWHTPRIFIEYNKDLCEDAKAFKEEVKRRRSKTISNPETVPSGDRVRAIGHDDIFKEEDYKGFPENYKSYPGTSLTVIDGKDFSSSFEAFIHAPFKDGNTGDRNETSLALQIQLINGDYSGKAIMFGDLSYPTLRRIFDKTAEKNRGEYLEWNLFLTPHHCSKKAMYWKTEEEESENLKEDIINDLEELSLDNSFIIASCESNFTDKKGDNPPHQKARNQYEKIVDAGHFVCAHEYPSKDDIKPIVFEVTADGFSLKSEKLEVESSAKQIASGLASIKATTDVPKKEYGFG